MISSAVEVSTSITGSATANSTPTEFSFRMVHDAFGKEILNDLAERKRQKENAEKPLIDF